MPATNIFNMENITINYYKNTTKPPEFIIKLYKQTNYILWSINHRLWKTVIGIDSLFHAFNIFRIKWIDSFKCILFILKKKIALWISFNWNKLLEIKFAK